MSFQAVAWAFNQQDVKGTAKLVLVALCERADKHTGHCWPGMRQIAEDASCSERAAYLYIAALKRNGFIEVRNVRGSDGRQRANNYWILFDRPEAPWISDKRKESGPDSVVPNDDDDTTDCEPTAESAVGESAPEMQKDSGGPTANDCRRQESSASEPSELEPSARACERVPTAPAIIDRQAKQREIDAQKEATAEEARSENRVFPVIEGTAAWKAWVAHGHKPGLVTTIIVKGRHDRGWYFRSLWPPKSTGPPPSLMTAADHEELTRGI